MNPNKKMFSNINFISFFLISKFNNGKANSIINDALDIAEKNMATTARRTGKKKKLMCMISMTPRIRINRMRGKWKR